MTSNRVPESELEVLACLDRLGSATARQLREAMDAYRPMAHGSMMTLLKRLESRALVTRRKADTGKAFVYRPAPEASTLYGDLLGRLRRRVFGGDPVALVASLFDEEPPDEQELSELQALVDRLRDEAEEES